MSINKHPTKPDGWWQIRYRPDGSKGKQKIVLFEGTEEQARKHEQFIRAGLWDGNYETIESSYKKLKIKENNGPYVYFIQQGFTGPIKIGFTRDNLYARLKKLQTGNHIPLRLLAVIQQADIKQETELHYEFSSSRLIGEWFAPTDEIIKAVNKVRNKSIKDDLEEIFLSYYERIRELTEEQRKIAIEALRSETIFAFRKNIEELTIK